MTQLTKNIPDFPGYKIDTNGNVFSCRALSLVRCKETGKILTTNSYLGKKWKKLKTNTDKDGYPQVQLQKNKKGYCRKIHYLLLLTFKGERPIGAEVCHNNGIRTDNRLENLRWGTKSENSQDAVKHGTHGGFKKKGENNHNAKLTDEDIPRIRVLYNTLGWRAKAIAQRYNISSANIHNIIRGETWKHI